MREGDEYVVDGEKRWTSGGHRADYLWMLCRTGSLESHSSLGLSLLIVDRHSPGISVSPIAQVDGERFNEIRFEEVRVPVANRVGEENGAWPLMVESLATERHVQWCPKRVLRDFEDLVAWVGDCHLDDDPVVRNRIAELAVSVAEAQALGLTMVAAVQSGSPAVLEAAYNKLVGSESCQAIARAASDFGHPAAIVRGTPVEFPLAAVPVGDDRGRNLGGDARPDRPRRARAGGGALGAKWYTLFLGSQGLVGSAKPSLPAPASVGRVRSRRSNVARLPDRCEDSRGWRRAECLT